MSRWRWLASVPASLALHGAGLFLILWLFPRETSPPVIVLELSEVAVGNPALPFAPGPQAPARAGPGSYRRSGILASSRSASRPPAPTLPPKPQAESGSPVRTQLSTLAGVDVPRSAAPSPTVKPDRSDGQPTAASAGDGRSDRPGGIGSRENRGGEEALLAGLGQSGHGQNQDLALALPGAGQGGLSAAYGPYLALIRQKIQDSLEYPLAARRRSLTGTVHMEIVIQPTGAIGSVSVLRSSSHSILDEAALDAVRRLPALSFPVELPPRTLRVRLPVVFELR